MMEIGLLEIKELVIQDDEVYTLQGLEYLTSLERLSIEDVSSFDTSQVTSMSYMFYSCSNLMSLHISNFKTGNVIDMFNMFYYCTNLKVIELPNNFNINKINIDFV